MATLTALDKIIISDQDKNTRYLAICEDYEALDDTLEDWRQVWAIVKKDNELVFFL